MNILGIWRKVHFRTVLKQLFKVWCRESRRVLYFLKTDIEKVGEYCTLNIQLGNRRVKLKLESRAQFSSAQHYCK